MVKKIEAEQVIHRGQKRIALKFAFDRELIEKVKKIDGVRWSATMGCWHVPFTEDFQTLWSECFHNENILIDQNNCKSKPGNESEKGCIHCEIDRSDNLIYFNSPYEKRHEVKKLEGIWWHSGAKKWSAYMTEENLEFIKKIFQNSGYIVEVSDKETLYKKKKYYTRSKLNVILDKRFKMEMELRNYSHKTIETYCEHINRFLHTFNGAEIEKLPSERIREYIYKELEKTKFSARYQNQVISSIKKYYELVFRRELDAIELPRPKIKRNLPKVISKDEVMEMVNKTGNIKHRLILCLLYGCGLRRNEVVELKTENVDIKNRTIMIKGKGNKYRMLPLGVKITALMESYIKSYLPGENLFYGHGQEHYSTTSIANMVRKQAEKAGIKRKVTPHMLRHSFATHHMENGIELRFIQEMLGHRSSKTTEIYTHVSRKNLKNIPDLLDL